MKRLKRWSPFALSAASGALAAWSDPGYGVSNAVWVALVPLLWALQGQPTRARFARGWLAGFVFFLLILPWLWTLWDWAGPLIVLGYLGLCALLALGWGAWAVGLGWLGTGRALALWTLAPAAWVVLEVLRSIGPFGFTWGTLGYALYAHPSLLALAAWTGLWGLSFLIVWVNVGVFLAWQRREARWLVLVGALVLALVLWGRLELKRVAARQARAPTLELALVQPNIPQREKSDPRRLEALKDRYRRLLAAIDRPVDLVVLPESILPALVLESPELLDWLQAFARERGSAVLFGSFTRREAETFNSAVWLTPEGGLAGQYDKVQLVPFSTEYFPGVRALERLGWARVGALGLGGLTRGAGFAPLGGEGVTVGTPICFESAFPGIGRAFVRAGAQLLITITNDAWFKESIELRQHFAFGALRAAETRRSFVQVANTGQSGVILPTGEIAQRPPPHRAEVSYARVPLLEGQTAYVRYGELWVGLVALGLLARLGWRWRERQSSQPSR